MDGRVDLKEPHAILVVNVTSHYSAGRIALRRGGGDCEELCWSSCQQSDRQQTKQDLINVFSLGELCFLDLNRFEGITYLPSEATQVASPALCDCSTPRKQEWGVGVVLQGGETAPQFGTDQVSSVIISMQKH